MVPGKSERHPLAPDMILLAHAPLPVGRLYIHAARRLVQSTLHLLSNTKTSCSVPLFPPCTIQI